MRLEVVGGVLLGALMATAGDMMSDTWVATDGLGRKLPTAAEVGPLKTNRQVAIFYFLWHANYYPNGSASRQGPFDVAKMLEQDPQLLDHPDSPLLGPFGTFHHWGEPLLGYYVGTDRAVYRKHAQWLSDAGVDAVIFDTTTNGPIYGNTVTNLLEGFAEVDCNALIGVQGYELTIDPALPAAQAAIGAKEIELFVPACAFLGG